MDGAGDTINVGFVGVYDATDMSLDIQNLSTDTTYAFGFDFEIRSDGALYVTHDLGGGFFVQDNNNGLTDYLADGSSYYVLMSQG